MSPTDDLAPLLKKLRLSGVLATLQLRVDQATQDELPYPEFLLRLLTDEVERREAKMLDQRIRKASFEHQKTLEDFDFLFNPQVPKSKVIDLATCGFVQRKRNVVLVGPSGVGKSHIAQALGHRACRAGFKVLYVAATDMLKHLRAARGDASYDKRMLRFTGPDLLILDDVGLRKMSVEEAGDLYEVIRLRHARGSIIATSNRDLGEWPAIFHDPLLASAALDRLFEEAAVLTIPGDSFRNPPAKKRASRQTTKEKIS